MIQKGKYKAKPVDWTVKTTQKGSLCVEVHFNVEGQGSVKYQGYLTEKTAEKTIEQLINMGYKKGTDPRALVDGVIGGALDKNKEVIIDVIHETSDKGKTYAKVKWINAPYQAKQATPQEKASAKDQLGALSGLFTKVTEEKGAQATVPNLAPTKSVGF